jgi:hypothetical protein
MTEPGGAKDEAPHVTYRAVEAGVALALIVVGTVVAVDSERIGAGWGPDGPQAGYFPFYIGILLTIAGISVLLNVLRLWKKHLRPFVTYAELGQVLSVLVPTAIFVAVIYFLGIYVASAIFIGWFMITHGKFGKPLVAAISIGVPLMLFMLFEKWFLVPLPKGPLERLLGY